MLAKYCPNLERLDFPGNGWYSTVLTGSLPLGLDSGIPSAKALSRLRALRLSRVGFKEASTLQRMLSRLPQLQLLDLENVFFKERTKDSMLRLVSASVVAIHLTGDSSFELLEINAPELKTLVTSAAEKADEDEGWYVPGAELRFLEVCLCFPSSCTCFD